MDAREMLISFDLDFMSKAFSLVDQQYEVIEKYMEEDFAHDGESALVDDGEFLHAIGFVTAQKYLASICRVLEMEDDKKKAFAVGPQIQNVTFAQLIHAVANHWKHADEWDYSSLDWKQNPTVQVLQKVGLEPTEYGGGYVASNALHKMGLKKFTALTPFIKQWSDAAMATFPHRA